MAGGRYSVYTGLRRRRRSLVASDYVVLVATHETSGPAVELAKALHHRGFTVVANEAAGGVSEYSVFLQDAAAVVVVCGDRSSAGESLQVDAVLERVVPVKVAHGARLPKELEALEALDLSESAKDGPELELLTRRLGALVDDARQVEPRDPSMSDYYALPLDAGEYAVSGPIDAISELGRLAQGVGGVATLLATDAEQTKQFRETLREIGNSYRVVQSAIDEFYASGADADRLDLRALAKIRGGSLATRIHDGRGHCKRIGARYNAEGGPRSALKTRVSAQDLESADWIFRELAEADIDLFRVLDSVGMSLAFEARKIYPLVIAGQRAEALRRFEYAHVVLAPLEAALQTAMRKFQDIEQSLGYAPDSPSEVPHVDDRSVHVYGSVTNSVVASTIKDSRITLKSAQLPAELRASMEELIQAVGAMAEKLSADDAEAAAIELEQLTAEVSRERPKVGIIKKCLRSLELFGKSVADVGLPVVELATKIAGLF
jgi:hypothetical protein